MAQGKITIIENFDGNYSVEQYGELKLSNLTGTVDEVLDHVKITTDGEIELPDGTVVTGTMNDLLTVEPVVEPTE